MILILIAHQSIVARGAILLATKGFKKSIPDVMALHNLRVDLKGTIKNTARERNHSAAPLGI